MNKRLEMTKEFAEKLNSDKINTIILIISDYWEEIDSEITKLVGDIMYHEDELISAHVMNTKRFENTKHYSFLSNVLEDGIILV